MKPEERKDALDRVLGRLGSVSPEVLASARERIRRSLKARRRPMMPLLPLPDASPASLAALRRPFYVGGAMAVACVLLVVGVVLRWGPEAREVVKTLPRSVSKQAPQSAESNREATPILPPRVEPPTPLRPERQQPEKRLLTKADPQPEQPIVQISSSQTRFTLLPPGDGRVLLDRACGGCHRAAAVGTHHFATRADYAELVTRMVGKGAPLSEREAEVLVDYLFDNLRIKPEPPVETAGLAILERACTTCHSLNGIENYAYNTEDPYQELVSTMVSYGAMLSDAEKTTLIQYLFATYGKR